MMNEAQWQLMRTQVISQFGLHPTLSAHAPDHWERVELYGILLCSETGADLVVVRLFALFHDCRRLDEGSDPEHGLRAAHHARLLCGAALDLEPGQLDGLLAACHDHDKGALSLDPTVGTCWDADRLDLDRVGMVTDPRYMSTDYGCRLAAMLPRERQKLAGIIGERHAGGTDR
jgi:uncharacterized protein